MGGATTGGGGAGTGAGTGAADGVAALEVPADLPPVLAVVPLALASLRFRPRLAPVPRVGVDVPVCEPDIGTDASVLIGGGTWRPVWSNGLPDAGFGGYGETKF